MANNIVETIQRNLGFSPLQKIDPNDQETKRSLPAGDQKLGQAAIPAVLTALYRFTRTEAGARAIISGFDYAGWLRIIFLDKEGTAVQKVAGYAGVAEADTKEAMEKVADEAVSVLRHSAGEHVTAEKIRAAMDVQRHNILVTLPAALQMGELLDEEVLDDRTHKMEGPVSNFLHKIESFLSKSDQSKYP